MLVIIFTLTLTLSLIEKTTNAKDEKIPNIEIEKRALSLDKEIRCLVCQNQAIVDSNAPLAKQMKVIIRERIIAGDTNKEVKNFLVARYGDWILLKPPFKLTTFILWLGPFFILLLILFISWQVIYKNKIGNNSESQSNPLNNEEKQKLKSIIEKYKSG